MLIHSSVNPTFGRTVRVITIDCFQYSRKARMERGLLGRNNGRDMVGA